MMCKGTREQAAIVGVVHPSEVINKKADGQTNPEGQAKVKNQTQKGCLSNISRIWHTGNSAQKNYQRSDRV